MKKLGYLFLVAAVGSIVLAPAFAEAGEGRHHRGDRGQVARPAPPPQLSYTPTHQNPRHGYRHWKPRPRGHWKRHGPRRHWGHWKRHHRGHGHRHGPRRHWGHWKRRHHRRHHGWNRHRKPVRRHLFAPPATWAPAYGGSRYADDIGSVDFSINYRLFF